MSPAPAATRCENPFPGLLSFEPEQSKYFYGRNKQIEQVLRHLEQHRFLAVIGSSGCGKSSLVRAGLLPSLYRGYLGSGPNWKVAVMKPGSHPMTALADSLRSAECFGPEAKVTTEALLDTTRGLVAVAEPYLADGKNLLVVVDQFEEIFRFRRESEAADAEANHFVDLLLHASSRSEVRIHVVLTMRTDYLSDSAQFDGLPEAINRGQFLVPRLTRDERQEAIEGPLRFAGIPYSARLVQQVLNDFGDDPNNLPVLQHALRRTVDHWQRQGGDGLLDVEHYEAVSTSVGAIEKHCEQVYEPLSAADRKLAEKLFRCLTTVDRGRRVRRPGPMELLREVTGGGRDLDGVIDEFAKEGFVIKGRDGTVDLTHESLILRWQRLKAWVDQEHISAKWYQKLADAARNGLSPWRGRELEEARKHRREDGWNEAWASQYGAGFEEATGFLNKSGRFRTLRVAAAAALILLVVLSTAVFVYWLNQEKQRAEHERIRAERYELEAKSARDEALARAKEIEALTASSEMRKRLLEEAEMYKLNAAAFKQQAASPSMRPTLSAAAPTSAKTEVPPSTAKAAAVEPKQEKPSPSKETPKPNTMQMISLAEYTLHPIQGWEGRAAIFTGELPGSQKTGWVYFVLNQDTSVPAPILQKATSDKSVVKNLVDAADGESASEYPTLRFARISVSQNSTAADGVLERFRTRSGAWFTVSLKEFTKPAEGGDRITLQISTDAP